MPFSSLSVIVAPRPLIYRRAMSYAAYETLIAAARDKTTPVRLVLGVVLLAPVSMILSTFVLGFLIGALGFAGGDDEAMGAVLNGRSAQAVLLLLFSFTGYILALAIVLRLVHGRHLAGLIGPAPLTLDQGRRVFLAVAAFLVVFVLVPAGEGFALSRQHAFGEWVIFLLPALAGILVQVSAEELVFRGYFQSHLAALARNPLIWMGAPALLFGLLHYDVRTYGDNAWLIVLWAIGFGLAAADITARAGTLGPAIAMHVANNALAFLIAAPEGYLDGLALYTYDFPIRDSSRVLEWLPQEALATLCMWLCARLVLRR